MLIGWNNLKLKMMQIEKNERVYDSLSSRYVALLAVFKLLHLPAHFGNDSFMARNVFLNGKPQKSY